MHKLYELLERHGLGVNDDFPKIAIMSARQVRQMHEELFELVFEAQNERVLGESSPAHDAFSFLASASLRGTSGCGSWECLATKLHFLGRYAALYANELAVPRQNFSYLLLRPEFIDVAMLRSLSVSS